MYQKIGAHGVLWCNVQAPPGRDAHGIRRVQRAVTWPATTDTASYEKQRYIKTTFLPNKMTVNHPPETSKTK